MQTARSFLQSAAAGRAVYSGLVLDLSGLDLEEIGNALADRTDYEHRWLINQQTGEIAFWTADTGIDGQAPVDLDELDLVCIDPHYARHDGLHLVNADSHAAGSSYPLAPVLTARTAESMICSSRLLWAPCQYTWPQLQQRENVW